MAIAQLATGTPGTDLIGSTTQISALNDVPAKIQQMIVPELIVELGGAYGINTEIALKIARCESNLKQFGDNGKVIRGRENASDVGVFQINERYHLKKSADLGFDIETAEGNIEYAVWLMKHEGTRHWIWSKSCWNK